LETLSSKVIHYQMKVLIFGASGATGHNLISQAVEQGHEILAFVRDPSKLKIVNKSLKTFKGDVVNYQQVAEAVQGQEAVISALGASNPVTRNYALISGIENIVQAMTKHNVSRLVYQSFLGVREHRQELGFIVNRVLPILLKGSIKDHEEKEKIITTSNLQWTIVRCPTLTNGPLTKKYVDGERLQPQSALAFLSRADVADFMLRQLSENKYIRKKPRIMKK
jgi:putative NADH-flavin reductase